MTEAGASNVTWVARDRRAQEGSFGLPLGWMGARVFGDMSARLASACWPGILER